MPLLNVLLVEDDHRDALLTERAFSKIPDIVLQRAETGEDALSRLGRAVRLPHVVLLDLNLPGIDGHTVLTAIKQDPHLQHIPIVALTSSADDHDVIKSWRLHVSGYLRKPIRVDDFRAVAAQFAGWWSSNELGIR